MFESKVEKIVLWLLSLTFFIGIWHGFPFTNVVADEMYFSGSVLRSMEANTILPLPLDVPYGTLTFYLSYIVIGIGLSIMSVFYLFDLTALKFFIVQNPFVVYSLARLVSFGLAVFCLFAGNNILKRYINDYRIRLTVITLLFTNILINIIFHTSKVWVLSTVLQITSFYFLVRVFDDGDTKKINKNIFWSVILAFLSFANFPFMGMNLINIPILLYKFWKNREYRKTLLKAVILGGILFLVIVLSNFSGVRAQVFSIVYDYTLSPNAIKYNASIAFSAYLHVKKILVMFPLLVGLLAYLFVKSRVKHKNLFVLSSIYLVLYVFLIIAVDRWSLVDKAALRYSFPIPFLITFLIASFDIKWRKLLLFLPVISVLYLIPTLYYLSVGTTSHQAVRFIRESLSNSINTVIYNKVGADTPAPINRSSYDLFDANQCGSLCNAELEYNFEKDFKPITVLDSHTNMAKLANVMKGADQYYVLRSASTSPSLDLVASFTAPVLDLNYYSADNSGSYFDPLYFKLERFGPNIYIYKYLMKI